MELVTAKDLQPVIDSLEGLTSFPVDADDLRTLILRVDKAETSAADVRTQLLDLQLKCSLAESSLKWEKAHHQTTKEHIDHFYKKWIELVEKKEGKKPKVQAPSSIVNNDTP